MRRIPASLNAQFNTLLVKNKIPQKYQIHYLKWLRYYLDFCHKYGLSESSPQSLPNFIRKLKEKRQTDAQQKQANKAIHIYYELIRSESSNKKGGLIKHLRKPEGVDDASYRAKLQTGSSKRDSAQNKPIQTGAKDNWDEAYRQLSNEIKFRHYSPKTLKSYSTWVRKIQYFSKSKDPELLSTTDVKDFLTFLAVKRKVSASSQNQAFNALLFFSGMSLTGNSGKLTVWYEPKENDISLLYSHVKRLMRL